MKKIAITTLAAAALLTAGCAIGHASTSTGTGLSPAVQRLDARQAAWEKAHPALFHCEVAVDTLLAQDLVAIENGYSGGIDPNQVMTQYGVQSAIFQAYIQLQGQLIDQVDQYGTTGALQPVYRQVVATCQQYGADPPPGQQPPATGQPASPAPASAPASTVPPANARGCPSPAQLLAAWDAAPAARWSWITGLSPSGMADITCWRTWAVASPVVQANGLIVFRKQGGQWHLLPETELSRFDTAVCGSSDAPAAWSSPTEGPATCS